MIGLGRLAFAIISFILFVLSIQAAQSQVDFSQMTWDKFDKLSDQAKTQFLDKNKNKFLKVIDLAAAPISEIQSNYISEQVPRVVEAEETLWSDTILEGDYTLTGPARFESVEIYFYRDQIYAYGVHIQAPATFNGEEEHSAGQIVVYKLYDREFNEIDNGNYAEFVD